MITFVISSCVYCASGSSCEGGRHWVAGVKAKSKKSLYWDIFVRALYALETGGQIECKDEKSYPCFVFNSETEEFEMDTSYDHYPYERVICDFLTCSLFPPDDEVMKNYKQDRFDHPVMVGSTKKWLNKEHLRLLVERCVQFEDIETI